MNNELMTSQSLQHAVAIIHCRPVSAAKRRKDSARAKAALLAQAPSLPRSISRTLSLSLSEAEGLSPWTAIRQARCKAHGYMPVVVIWLPHRKCFPTGRDRRLVWGSLYEAWSRRHHPRHACPWRASPSTGLSTGSATSCPVFMETINDEDDAPHARPAASAGPQRVRPSCASFTAAAMALPPVPCK